MVQSIGDVIEGVPCPRCGGILVYNGNYFCSDIVECRWVLEEKDHGSRLQLMLAGLIMTRKRLGRDTAREEGYLDEDGRHRLTELENS